MAHRSRTNNSKAARADRIQRLEKQFLESYGPGSRHRLTPAQLEAARLYPAAFKEARESATGAGQPLRDLWYPELNGSNNLQLPRLSLPNELIAARAQPCRFCDGIETDLHQAANPAAADYCRKCWNLYHDYKRDRIRRALAESDPETVCHLFVAATDAVGGAGTSDFDTVRELYRQEGSIDAPGLMIAMIANTQYPLVQGQYRPCTHLLDREIEELLTTAPAGAGAAKAG